MKRIIAFLVVLTMLFSFCGCGSGSKTTENGKNNKVENTNIPIAPKTIINIGKYNDFASSYESHNVCVKPDTLTKGINNDTIIIADDIAPIILKTNLFFM